MSNRLFFLVCTLGLLLLSGCNGEDAATRIVDLGMGEGCDPVRKPCLISVQDRQVSLYFPQGIAYLTPFESRVDIEGFAMNEIRKVMLSFTMTDMDMGTNRFTLTRKMPGQRGGSFTGMGMLPVCISGRKDWQVTVELDGQGIRYLAHFPVQVTGTQ